MNKQPLKTSGNDVLSSWKKLRKNFWGGGASTPRPLYVRGLNFIMQNDSLFHLCLPFIIVPIKSPKLLLQTRTWFPCGLQGTIKSNEERLMGDRLKGKRLL